MHPALCSRCGKNPAVVYITKFENGGTVNEGLCLRCAKDLGIKPIDDMFKKMGINDEDLDRLTNEMMSALGGAEGLESLMNQPAPTDDGEDDGRTATFPFLNQLFGGQGQPPAHSAEESQQGGQSAPKQPKQSKRKFLDNYCINLSQRAKEGKLDTLIGRDRELRRVIQILNRRQKNNPCLIGEPGVGKTAIAEGLAQKIAAGEVPYKLIDKEVYLLDLTSLVAGTQFRGQFESRMKGLIEEIKKLGNIILVIDEVHNIVGAGDAEGSMNAANILKPALSRGELQVIGATTLNEYRKHIEKDTALERRFQSVVVEEPSMEDSVKILEGIAPYYEKYHQVTISPDICRQAVTMSERYITDRYLPDKAIDLIDEACSNINLENRSLARLADVEKELADLAKEREVMTAAATDQSYERLATIRSMELRLNAERDSLMEQPQPALDEEHLANVIELWTNIPASRIQEQEYQRLAKLEERLKAHIIGQDEAVSAVSAAVRRGRVGISPKHKPVSFIFVGSTGVGKTELVKQLSADLFDTPESLIRLDMSEFMEKHAVSRIIGSPPGYVGYDEAGQLTEKIRRKPYCVVLFDEIEKAHPDVLNILLQILDDGRITDAHGRVVNFENTVIVMTSNAGSNQKSGTVGFGRTANEQNRDRVIKALQEFLRPEFINRVDEIISFNQLTEGNFRDIAALMLKELAQAMEQKKITFTWEESLVDYLVKKSYSPVYGARNLRRTIQKELEDAIAMRLIEGYESPVSHMKAYAQQDKIELVAM